MEKVIQTEAMITRVYGLTYKYNVSDFHPQIGNTL